MTRWAAISSGICSVTSITPRYPGVGIESRKWRPGISITQNMGPQRPQPTTQFQVACASGFLARLPEALIGAINLLHSLIGKCLKFRCQARNLVRMIQLRQTPICGRDFSFRRAFINAEYLSARRLAGGALGLSRAEPGLSPLFVGLSGGWKLASPAVRKSNALLRA
jgi:hypothetical protein